MKKLALSKPPESDRIIGFTIPKAGLFYICDHDEVWKVRLGSKPNVEVTDHAPYDFARKRTDFLGLSFKGCVANEPLLLVGDTRIRYDFDPRIDFVEVTYEVAGRSGTIEFETASGDWFATSLSDNGRFLILAEPYGLAAYDLAEVQNHEGSQSSEEGG